MRDNTAKTSRHPESDAAPDWSRLRVTRRDALKFGAVGAAAAGLLAACGTTASPSAPTKGTVSTSGPVSGTLTVWDWAGGAADQAGFDAVKAAYPKEFGDLTITVSTPVTGDFQMAEKLTLALSANTPLPDIAFLNYTELAQFALAGVLEDISAYVSPVASDLYTGAKALTEYNGTPYAFPYQLNGKLFYYRSDLFTEAGIDVEALDSVDSFIAAGHKFTQKFPGQYIWNIDTQPPEYVFGEVVSAFAPVQFVNRKGVWDITTDPAFYKTFEFLHQVKASGIAFPVDDFTAGWPEAIANQRICGYLGADWMKDFLPQYAGLSQRGKWEAALWPPLQPYMADERYGSDAGGSIMVVFKDAPNKDAALALANKARFDHVGAMAFFGASGTPPLMKSLESSVLTSFKTAKKPSTMSETTWLELPQNYFGPTYFAKEFECYNYVKIFGYDPGAIKEWGTLLEPPLDKAVAGTLSISEALSQMQASMESQVGNPYSAS